MRRLIIISAVAAVALGTAAAAADDYSRKLAPWAQLTQATEKPPGEKRVGPLPMWPPRCSNSRTSSRCWAGRSVASPAKIWGGSSM